MADPITVTNAAAGAVAGAVTNSDILVTLLLCGLMGLIGQGVRAVVGLKNASAPANAPPGQATVFSASYLFVSLMIGFIAGILAGLAIFDQIAKGVDIKILLGIAAAGYAGVDFIENTFSKLVPNIGGPPAPHPAPAPTGTSLNIRPP